MKINKRKPRVKALQNGEEHWRRPVESNMSHNERFLRDAKNLLSGFNRTVGTALTGASLATMGLWNAMRLTNLGTGTALRINAAKNALQGARAGAVADVTNFVEDPSISNAASLVAGKVGAKDLTKTSNKVANTVSTVLDSDDMIEKKKINTKAPSYAFGVDAASLPGTIAGASQLAGTLLQSISGADSGAAVAGSALSGAGSLAGAGAMLGGPVGAAIGGGVGLVGGLIGGIKRRKAEQKRQRQQASIEATQRGLDNAAQAEDRYWDENTLAYTYANGGKNLAYVDNDEVLRTTDGTIHNVPNTKPGTDNHLIDATNLDSVLSDNLKVPGTNRTFAQEGKRLSKLTKSSEFKNRYSENSDMLNKRNANKKYNDLLNLQEEVKAKKGIKPKSKSVPAMANGEEDWSRRLSNNITDWAKNFYNDIVNSNWAESIEPMPGPAPGRTYRIRQSDNSVDGVSYVDPMVAPYINVEDFTPTLEPVATPTTIRTTAAATSTKPTVTTQRITTEPLAAPAIPKLEVNRMAYPTTVDMSTIRVPRVNPVDEKPYTNYTGTIAELAPTLYNFVQGIRGPETEPLVYNPMQPAVMRTMARRRANIEPTLRANRRSRAIANYNASNINTNTGMNMAMRTQLAADEYNANADAYARRDNVNNEYLAQYASTLSDLGNQWVQARNLYQDLNARNRAAARNYTGAAATQLSNWYQTEERMRNQAARDAQVLPFLADFLRGGFTNEQVENLINRTRQGA